jgi:hypothetical protein
MISIYPWGQGTHRVCFSFKTEELFSLASTNLLWVPMTPWTTCSEPPGLLVKRWMMLRSRRYPGSRLGSGEDQERSPLMIKSSGEEEQGILAWLCCLSLPKFPEVIGGIKKFKGLAFELTP